MKRFKKYLSFILILGISITSCFGQINTKKKQIQIDVNNNDNIELNTTYTNIEIELTNNNTVIINAIMDIDGLSNKEANNYFNNWNLETSKNQNNLVINSTFKNKNTNNLNKNGYYNGYFIETKQLEEINAEINSFSQDNIKISNTDIKNESSFNYDLYIKEGNKYLDKWQKNNKESVGKRWFNKTKKERIALRKAAKKRKPNKNKLITKKQLAALNPQKTLQNKINKKLKPKTNIRALSNRAIINKTLKIKIPKHANLTLNTRHGKVTISNEINNLKANLSYVLLVANNITGTKTQIKSTYSNFEINNWSEGKIETAFSNFVLIKKVKNIDITSNSSTVSIDKISNSLNAKGNFKMLSVDFSLSFKQALIDIVDSKKVWIKLPKTKLNLKYHGKNSNLIHSNKYLKSIVKKDLKNEIIEHLPLKNNKQYVQIIAKKSTLQVYDIPWEDLKIKNFK